MTAAVSSAVRRSAVPASLLTVIGGLYLCHGMVNGFVIGALPTFLRQGGVSVEAVGLSTLVMAPWAVSFLWAPSVDRRTLFGSEHRKSWLIPLHGALPFLMVAVGACLLDLPLGVVMALTLVMVLISATSDISAHGLAAERLTPESRSWGNGLQVGGQWLGIILGAAGVLALSDGIGVFGAVACLAVLIAATVVPTILFREGPRPAAGRGPNARPRLTAYLARPDTVWMALLILLADFGRGFTMPMQAAMLVDLNFSATEIGFVRSGLGAVTGLAGAGLGAMIVGPLGRGPALLVSVATQAAAIAAYAAITWAGITDLWVFGVVLGVESLAVSMTIVCLYTIIMDGCTTGQAGTDFAVPYCFGNLVVTGSGAVSGLVAGQIGYGAHFSVCAAVCLIGALLTPVVYKRVEKARSLAKTGITEP